LRLFSVAHDGREEAAIALEDGLSLVRKVEGFAWEGETDLRSLLKSGGFHGLKQAYDGGEVRGEPLSPSVRGPLYRRPRKIWGIGLNYVDHASDLDERSPTDEPASFMRPDTTIIGPGDDIVLPSQSERVTAEGELAVIIGQEARDVSEEEASSVVAGFTTVLDMTAEDILRKNPRYLTRAKSFDTFFSFGPEFITPDEIEDVNALEVSTALNGEVRRTNTVSNMTFSPYWLVSFHSKVMTLLPGDVISTGTPGAVVVRDGDVAECRITGFEPLSNPVVRSTSVR
jgi:2-keto-4-pentenoate hydratase/2-oxohepta-3-ene-1,7-dioic acid hydratase in catechol pathway